VTVVGITGASGALGRRTAHYVLEAHPPTDVVLFSRTPASLSDFTKAGATVRRADLDQPDTLAQAFRGLDVLLLISTDAIGRRAPQHEAAIAAAATAGVGRVVYTSTANADRTFPAQMRPLTDDHAATEKALRRAGPSWTVLRNAFYFEATAEAWAQAGVTGQLVSNNGSGRYAPVSRDDCAAAAAAALTTDGHDNVISDITGPRLVDDEAVCAALAAHHGRPIDVMHVTDEDYERGLLAAGLPADIASLLTGFGASIRTGLMETPLGDTEKLTGRTPTGIEEFLAKRQDS
jgi:NAD(P)H dehydrogenase (quinone)